MRKHHWQKGFFDLEVPELTEEAVEFVRQNITEENYPVPVAFSGGKDSVCLAKIMELSGIPYQLNYAFTGIDPPEVVRFIRRYYPHAAFRKPKQTFWKLMYKNVPPTVNLRWCCEKLKKKPQAKGEKGKTQKLLGIRAEESSSRSKRGRINLFKKAYCYNPLFYWNEAQIWEFIEYYHLEVPALYDQGLNRIGCVICPFHSLKEHEFNKKMWPKIFHKWEKEVTKYWYLRQSQGRIMHHNSPEEFLNDWYKTGNPPFYASRAEQEKKKNGLWLLNP